jgi:hypothetical protein
MHIAPHELLFIGACIGWVLCALCFWLIPSWRVADIYSMDDESIVRRMIDLGNEYTYRHPDLRENWEHAIAGWESQL